MISVFRQAETGESQVPSCNSEALWGKTEKFSNMKHHWLGLNQVMADARVHSCTSSQDTLICRVPAALTGWLKSTLDLRKQDNRNLGSRFPWRGLKRYTDQHRLEPSVRDENHQSHCKKIKSEQGQKRAVLSLYWVYTYSFLFLVFQDRVLYNSPKLSWNSLCRPGWPRTQRSACLCLRVLELKEFCTCF